MNLQNLRGRWKADVQQQSCIKTSSLAISGVPVILDIAGTQTSADITICKQNNLCQMKIR